MEKEKCDKIIDLLEKSYPYAGPQLLFSNPFELLVAVILSAQCTDKRVNEVTKQLFPKFNSPQKIVELGQVGLENIIKSCGLYHAKAKHIISASKDIIERFNGEVPQTVDELKTLDGVGQKTANVVFIVAFDGDAMPVDTHVFRLANRIGLASSKTAFGVEKQLCELIEKSKWSKTHHCLILHGRNVCKAQNPNCQSCTIYAYCEKNGVQLSKNHTKN